mmetsp:Transcript_99060/g.174761  ORF Transcript_99060/g.174761 Transcript_99060/m.174761 type:complete len:488 (+) Transcript_99060:81-1544(+)
MTGFVLLPSSRTNGFPLSLRRRTTVPIRPVRAPCTTRTRLPRTIKAPFRFTGMAPLPGTSERITAPAGKSWVATQRMAMPESSVLGLPRMALNSPAARAASTPLDGDSTRLTRGHSAGPSRTSPAQRASPSTCPRGGGGFTCTSIASSSAWIAVPSTSSVDVGCKIALPTLFLNHAFRATGSISWAISAAPCLRASACSGSTLTSSGRGHPREATKGLNSKLLWISGASSSSHLGKILFPFRRSLPLMAPRRTRSAPSNVAIAKVSKPEPGSWAAYCHKVLPTSGSANAASAVSTRLLGTSKRTVPAGTALAVTSSRRRSSTHVTLTLSILTPLSSSQNVKRFPSHSRFDCSPSGRGFVHSGSGSASRIFRLRLSSISALSASSISCGVRKFSPKSCFSRFRRSSSLSCCASRGGPASREGADAAYRTARGDLRLLLAAGLCCRGRSSWNPANGFLPARSSIASAFHRSNASTCQFVCCFLDSGSES